MEIPEHLISILDELYFELSSQKLEVCLIPNKDISKTDRKLRVATSINPEWYQELCNNYPSTRNRKKKLFDTKIKRKYILKVFERMIRNKKSKSIYAKDLLKIAKDRFELYEKLKEGELIPWDNQF